MIRARLVLSMSGVWLWQKTEKKSELSVVQTE